MNDDVITDIWYILGCARKIDKIGRKGDTRAIKELSKETPLSR
jgi:hypothetical protein